MFYLYICVVFYRRKILLALLQIFDNKLDKIRLQKLLFLFSQKQEKPNHNYLNIFKSIQKIIADQIVTR